MNNLQRYCLVIFTPIYFYIQLLLYTAKESPKIDVHTNNSSIFKLPEEYIITTEHQIHNFTFVDKNVKSYTNCNRGYSRLDDYIRTHSWQSLRNGLHIYLYSAYTDNRDVIPVIRIIVMLDIWRSSLPKFCKVWYKSETTVQTSLVLRTDIVPETHDTR